ncbi:molecular chaperone TorD family protein [Deferribacterales bacterium Es71-Z0220]|jgi:TorA maturation chaperone TorD|uniref:TorD/DmsD family molecular chaperone n=1 Tax=Deferrivibrio essentukiensis TaxID=2880922 RepID=UPI001F6128A1|nr:molecular chaperone TorD family protein [Deferrivibrio essentukiensis]MCB4205455.1 molecular chaperone TorD family protein [Deferrivibrio essentukiensis]
MENNEINSARIFVYEIIKEAFFCEPTYEFIDTIKQFITNVKESFDDSDSKANLIVDSFKSVFNELSVEDIQTEYNNLFVDPFSNNLINKNASYYFENKNFGKTLVEIRDFLKELNLARDLNYYEPEDSISFVSDLMIYLINKNGVYIFDEQVDFFNRFVEPFFSLFSEKIKTNEGAVFYACMGLLIDYFLDLERSYLNESITT